MNLIFYFLISVMLHFLVLTPFMFDDERKFFLEDKNNIVVEIINEKNISENYTKEFKIPEKALSPSIEKINYNKKVNFDFKNLKKNKIKKQNNILSQEKSQSILFKRILRKDNFEKKSILNAQILIDEDLLNYDIQNIENTFFKKSNIKNLNLNSKLQFDQLNVFPQNLKNIFEIQKKENFFKVSKISENIINNKQVDLSNFQEIKKISLNTNLVKSVNFETGKLKKNNSHYLPSIDNVNFKRNNDHIALWGEMIKNEISNNLFYPKKALNKQIKGTVFLKMKVTIEGKLLSLDVDRSSGSKILDIAAIKAIKKLKSLPKAPKEIKKKSIIFNLPVNFTM